MRPMGIGWVFAAAALTTACGTPVPPKPLDPSALPAVEARAASLEERAEDGALLWRVTAERAREWGGEVDCETVTFIVPGGGVTRVGGDVRTLPALGFDASSPIGRVLRPDSGAGVRVELEGGFVVRLENGWTVSGATLAWDGERIRAAGNLMIVRPGMRMQGRDGVIDPRGPRIQMRSARGIIEGVTL